jgi:hypothetical protein
VLGTKANQGRAAATCDGGATPRGEEDPFQRSSHVTVLDPLEGAHLYTQRPRVYHKHGFPLVGSKLCGVALLLLRSDSPVKGLCMGAVAGLNGEDLVEKRRDLSGDMKK